MSRPPTTLLAVALGAVLGFALAVSGGVLAQRQPDAQALPWRDARLLAEVIERVKTEYVDPVDDHQLMQHAVRGMVAGLDAHSTFLDAGEYEDLRIATEGNYSGIGIEVSYEAGAIVVVAPIEGSPADRAGLSTGDVIVAIDGEPVESRGLAEAIGRMRGRAGTLVRVTVEREAAPEPIQFAIERAQVEVASVRHELLDGGHGYLRVSHFSEATAADVVDAIGLLRHAAGGSLAGLVLDLRNNPGGLLESGVEVADAFLERGLIVAADGRTPDARFRMEATPGDLLDGAPLAVLINAGSASAAEIVAGALRDHGRATLLGRRSFGKGSVQTLLPLSAGQAIKLTTSRYYTPSGTSIHHTGLAPDIELPRREEGQPGLQAAGRPLLERDPELRHALDWLREQGTVRLAGGGGAP